MKIIMKVEELKLDSHGNCCFVAVGKRGQGSDLQVSVITGINEDGFTLGQEIMVLVQGEPKSTVEEKA